MSQILLPASRSATANLIEYSLAGRIVSGTSASGVGLVPIGSPAIAIANMGLKIGDVISCSAEVKSATPGEATRLSIQAYDASGVFLSNIKSSTPVDAQVFTRHVCENVAIPSGTTFLLPVAVRVSGAGSYSMRNVMINRGSRALPYEVPKRGALIPWQVPVRFALQDEQSVLRTWSGVSQVTSYPGRRWLLSGETEVLADDELREWQVAFDLLSDLGNTFYHVVPDYDGPSTGYRGANPVVKGAGQLGTSLDCDGVDPDTAIVKAGDYASITATSPKGNTNVQLLRLRSDATSNESGEVTLEFTRPIRQSPADNSVVQIFSPVAQFAFVTPIADYNLRKKRMASFEISAEERVLP